MNKDDYIIIDSKKFDTVLHQFTRLIGEAAYLRKALLDSIVIDEEKIIKKKRK